MKRSFTDFLLDVISDTPLFEMAYARSKAQDKVTSISPQIVQHLVKIFAVHSPNDLQHWKNEINGWLWDIEDIRLKDNKRITQYNYHDWLLNKAHTNYTPEIIKKYIERFRMEYPGTRADADPEFIANQVSHILAHVAADLAENKFTSINDYL